MDWPIFLRKYSVSLIKIAKQATKHQLDAYDNYRGFGNKLGAGVVGGVTGIYGAAVGGELGGVPGAIAGGLIGAALGGGGTYALANAITKRERELYRHDPRTFQLNTQR